MNTDEAFGSESTKRHARDILVEMLPEAAGATDDALASGVLSEHVLERVLDIAWEFQFDDNRAACQRELRELVEQELEQRSLESRL